MLSSTLGPLFHVAHKCSRPRGRVGKILTKVYNVNYCPIVPSLRTLVTCRIWTLIARSFDQLLPPYLADPIAINHDNPDTLLVADISRALAASLGLWGWGVRGSPNLPLPGWRPQTTLTLSSSVLWISALISTSDRHLHLLSVDRLVKDCATSGIRFQ